MAVETSEGDEEKRVLIEFQQPPWCGMSPDAGPGAEESHPVTGMVSWALER